MHEAAEIHTGGSCDFMAPSLPSGMTRRAAAAWIREDPQAADKVFRDLMSASTGTRRAVQNGMFTFACPSPAAWFSAALGYTLAGVSWQIRCPTLVIGTEAERAFKGQARTLYDAHLPQGIPDVHHRGRRRGPLPGGLAVAVRPAHLRLAPGNLSRAPAPSTA
jgi:hypothetical protein